MKLGSSRGMDTKRPRGSERSKPRHELQLTRRSQPPYPWPPEQAQPGVSKPCRTTILELDFPKARFRSLSPWFVQCGHRSRRYIRRAVAPDSFARIAGWIGRKPAFQFATRQQQAVCMVGHPPTVTAQCEDRPCGGIGICLDATVVAPPICARLDALQPIKRPRQRRRSALRQSVVAYRAKTRERVGSDPAVRSTDGQIEVNPTIALPRLQ